MKSSVSICIPTLNRPNVLRRLLVSILQHDYSPFEILVIDASDDSLTKQVCIDLDSSGILKYIYSERKQLTYQRNIAIKEANGDYILFLDDDIILERGCIRELKSFLDNDLLGEFAAVGPVILNEFGKEIYKYQRIYYRLGIYESLEPGTWLRCGDFIQNSFFPLAFEGFKLTSFLAAGTTMFRRNVIASISPDSNFKFGGEDKHWTLRISQKYKLGICGSAGLYHEHFPGGGRKGPIVQGKNSMLNLYKILVDCDRNVNLKRKVFFQTYTLIDLNRQFWSLLVYLRIKGYLRIFGSFIGWLMNLAVILSKK